ncbi:MAG: hypothetical protein WBA93_29105 [Microcoleaceae cyanobacterium]
MLKKSDGDDRQQGTGNSGATPRRRQLACGTRTPVRQQFRLSATAKFSALSGEKY